MLQLWTRNSSQHSLGKYFSYLSEYVMYQKVLTAWLWRRFTKKTSAQWGLHTMKSILMSCMMVIKNPSYMTWKLTSLYVHVFNQFWWLICDIKIYIIMGEAHCVKFFFVNPLPFDIFLTIWYLSNILTSFCHFDTTYYLHHLNPSQAIILLY